MKVHLVLQIDTQNADQLEEVFVFLDRNDAIQQADTLRSRIEPKFKGRVVVLGYTEEVL